MSQQPSRYSEAEPVPDIVDTAHTDIDCSGKDSDCIVDTHSDYIADYSVRIAAAPAEAVDHSVVRSAADTRVDCSADSDLNYSLGYYSRLDCYNLP